MSARLGLPRWRLATNHHAIMRGLIRLAVIAGVLGLSAVFALAVASERVDVRFVLAVVLGAVGGVLLLRQRDAAPLGILLILATAGLANVVSLPTGSESRLVLSVVVALGYTVLWLLRMATHHKQIRLLRSRLNAPVLAWCAVSVIAYGWSLVFIDPLVYVPRSFVVVQMAALLVNILLPLQSLLVVNVIGGLEYGEGVRWLRRVVYLVLAIGAVAIVSELTGSSLSAFYSNGTRGLFSMWIFGLALALVLYDGALQTWARAALAALMAAWFYHSFVLHTAWLTGWLPMCVAGGVILFLRSRRLFAVAGLVVLAIAIANYRELYLAVVVSNVEEGSTSRLDLWSVALGYLVRHPLFGMGPAGYAVYYMTYDPFNARSTHNNFFDVTAQAGVIGLGIFLWLLAAAFSMGYRLTRSLQGERTFEAALAAAVTGGVVGAASGMMLGDWVLPFAYNQTISGFDNAVFTWILIGAGGALVLLRQRRGEAPA